MSVTAHIESLSADQRLPRSSHSLAVISNTLYILGGEVQPREPASPLVHAYDLKSGVLTPLPQSESSPSIRVGASSVVVDGQIYLWGGRGGSAMNAIDEGGRFWVYDPKTTSWASTPEPKGDIPEPRSYHAMTAIGDTIYLHAGCPAVGRRSTLHSYSLRDHTWTSLASAPGSPRGGTAFVALGSVLVRFGGFDGQELGGSVETYDTLANSWSTHPFEVGSGPGNRSVATFLPHPSYPTLKSVLIFGERSPSSKGHSGAGTFWSDIWVYDLEKDKWEQVEADISHVTEGGCGWGAGAVDLQSKELILWGGLDNQNQRVGTGLRVQIA